MNVRRAMTGFVGAVVLGTTLVMPAMAAGPTVTQQIGSGGSFTAAVQDATLTQVTYSNNAQNSNGTLYLSVSDPRGSSLGWDVSLRSSDFVWQGVANSNLNAHDIDAGNFTMQSGVALHVNAGQTIDGTHGPYSLVTAGTSLKQDHIVFKADAGYGSGNYTQDIPVKLAIPAMSQTGTYVATLTVTQNAAP